jgi:hypothetical protein
MYSAQPQPSPSCKAAGPPPFTGDLRHHDPPHRRTGIERPPCPPLCREPSGERRQLLAFYDYPVEHWAHLRTTNPIESTFATVRLRTKITKGHGSKAAGLAMAFKLIESAQRRWRMVNAPHLVALVRADAVFVNGKLAERPGQDAPPEAA